MARPKKNVHLDRQQAKAKKQKKLAIALSVVLVLVCVFEVPKTLKLMNPHPAAPVVNSSASAPPAANPTAPATSSGSTLPPPVATPTPTAALVNAVQVQADPGQLTEFANFASKDPFDNTVQPSGGGDSAPAASATTKKKAKPAAKPSVPKAPPAPPPTSAVISVNGELSSVTVNTDFPTSGTVFDQAGAPLFHLVSLTATTAEVTIAGGSYASGAATLKLMVGTPVTLQNTADGKRYTLLLEAQGTQVPTSTTTTPTSTTGSILPPPTSP